jgi:rhamnosyltransferase
MPSYFDAVLKHETIFTQHFADLGFTHDVAYSSADYPTDHPALFNPELLMADGCPILKRRPFFHWPPFLDRHAVIGRDILTAVESYGFPTAVIYENLARTVPPFTLNANAALLNVLDEGGNEYDGDSPLRVAVVAHLPSVAGAVDLIRRLAYFPDPIDLYVTTTASEVDLLRAALAELPDGAVATCDVRIQPSEDGRDMSAFLVGCADVISDTSYDLVFKMHARDGSRHGRNIATYRHRYLVESLLGSPGTVRSLLALFQREAGLGVAFPPLIHIGYATTGSAWSWYRGAAEELCRELGIRVPFDGVSPLAPLGGMWVARPEALAKLTEKRWTVRDFRDRTATKIPDLGRTIERLVAYAAGELGFHARTVTNAEHAALSHTALEYKLDQLATTTPGYPVEQIQFLHRAGWAGTGGAIAFFRMYMRTNHAGLVTRFDPIMAPFGRMARVVFRAGRRVAAVPRRVLRRGTGR